MTTAYWFKQPKTGHRIAEPENSMRDFRLPLRCQSNLRSFGTLRSVVRFLAEVSAAPIESHRSVLRSAWPLKMGPMSCPETSVINYHSTLRKIPKQCIFEEAQHYQYQSQLLKIITSQFLPLTVFPAYRYRNHIIIILLLLLSSLSTRILSYRWTFTKNFSNKNSKFLFLPNPIHTPIPK